MRAVWEKKQKAKRQVDYERFRRFLEDEKSKREFASTREFAKFLGVSHTTIGYFLTENAHADRTPALDVLEKIASKVSIPLVAILNIVFPDVRAQLTLTDLDTNEYRLIEAYRAGDMAFIAQMIAESLRKTFRDNPALTEDE